MTQNTRWLKKSMRARRDASSHWECGRTVSNGWSTSFEESVPSQRHHNFRNYLQTRVLIENDVMQLRGTIRTIKCHVESSTPEPVRDDSPELPWMVEHAGNKFSRCQKRSLRTDTCVVDCMEKKPHKEFIPLGEKVLATPMSTGRSFGVEKQQCRFCSGAAKGVFRARAVRRLEQNDRWDKEMIEAQEWLELK